MTGFETPSAGGDVRAAPWTGSSMGTVASALKFRDSESPAGGTFGALVTRGGRAFSNTSPELGGGRGTTPSHPTPDASWYEHALRFTADRQRPSSNVLNTEFDVSYLVPDGDGGYFGEKTRQ